MDSGLKADPEDRIGVRAKTKTKPKLDPAARRQHSATPKQDIGKPQKKTKTEKNLHPSQVIDEDIKETAYAWGGGGLAAFTFAFFMLMSDTRAARDAGFLLVLLAAGLLIYAYYVYSKSGALDVRCTKCNSNLAKCINEYEDYAGTYSVRKRVINNVTSQAEEVSVTKTDFKVTKEWKCGLCSNGWKTTSIRTVG